MQDDLVSVALKSAELLYVRPAGKQLGVQSRNLQMDRERVFLDRRVLTRHLQALVLAPIINILEQ